jgi:DNA-binding protein YbaB
MAEIGDQPHLDEMEKMTEMMGDPESMQQWMQSKQAEFDALPIN